MPALTYRRLIMANALAFVAVLALVAGGLYYVDGRDADRSRQICGLIVLIDDRQKQHPATDPDGLRFAQAVHDYRRAVGC